MPVTQAVITGADVLLAVAIFTALTGAPAFGQSLVGWYARTLGRRKDAYERLRRLGPGAQLSFFTAILGLPPALRFSRPVLVQDWAAAGEPPDEGEVLDPPLLERTFVESFFIDRDYYVQAITNEDEAVVAYSITTRTPRFRPLLTGVPPPSRIQRRRWKQSVGRPYRPLLEVRLGKTRFSELDQFRLGFGRAAGEERVSDKELQEFGMTREEWEEDVGPLVRYWVGARHWLYAEWMSFGNPGLYQDFVLATTDVSPIPAPQPGLSALMEEHGLTGRWPREHEDAEALAEAPKWSQQHVFHRYRDSAVVTTFAVIGPLSPWGPDDYPFGIGPHGDEVRTVP